jgi:hypothetical protein
MLTRAQWIGSGVTAAVALTAAGLAADSRETNPDVLAVIVPVLLAGALPADPAQRKGAVANTLDGFDLAVAGLTPSVQAEIAQLFALLRIAPLRIIATGIVGPWSRTPPERVAAFLEAWRFSRIGKLRSAYDALHQLVFAAWYGRPQSWRVIGYPGPPVVRQ